MVSEVRANRARKRRRRSWRRPWAGLVVGVLALGPVGWTGAYAQAALNQAREQALRVDPSGLSMPYGDLPGWRQIFRDDFRKDVPLGSFPSADCAKWTDYAEGWKDTSKNGTYSPQRVVSVHDGVMDLHLRTVDGTHLAAAPSPKLQGPGVQEGQLYGRYAVRYRADPIPGYKIAWLLWPDSEKWTDGEIDFPEGNLGGETWAFMHHRNKPTKQDWYTSPALLQQWHTAVIEWEPESVRFLLDGVVVGESDNAKLIPKVPMHWVLQTETSLDGRKPAADAAGHVEIDWVAAYSRN
jgi:beta-glucanase (GH16 family)